jgi:hypothetical protein
MEGMMAGAWIEAVGTRDGPRCFRLGRLVSGLCSLCMQMVDADACRHRRSGVGR